MIIYEVTLTIHRDCAADFRLWLIEHVHEMLDFTGFIKAGLYQNEENVNTEYLEWIVMYSVDTLESLNLYLAHGAPVMREKGLKRFPNQFTATRRILREFGA